MRSIHLETFGCQMNELDSELVRSHLSALGYTFTSDPRKADIILYNTCSVREQAENKVLSRVGIVGNEKKHNGRKVILGVIGCMAEREGPAMLRKYPQIDLMCGPGELDKLPMLLDNVLKTRNPDGYHDAPSHDRYHDAPRGDRYHDAPSHDRYHDAPRRDARRGASRYQASRYREQGRRGASSYRDRIALQGNNARRSSTLAAAEDNLEMLDLSRTFDPDGAPAGGKAAYVRITRGCNKFCTYCVVPNTRGPEVHRAPDAIIDECKMLADKGVIEVTLLGQTVNHYLYTHGTALSVNGREAPQVGPGLSAFNGNGAKPQAALGRSPSHRLTVSPSQRTTTFADLLRRIHEEVPAIKRLRFVTSFPLHFGDDVLRVMADSPRICRYLHVPAQSGSDRILKLMNRGYTREQYLEFIERARAILPGVEIAGDIIVGFPTETDEDFELTKELLRAVRFKNNFIFKYSPRPGTVAIKRFEDDVPEHIKRKRNNELLALQSEISAAVHAAYIGRTVDVFVEQLSEKAARRERAAATNGATGLTISAKPQAATPSPSQPLTHSPGAIQLSGRTSGDLITVFDCPVGADPADFIGRILPVRITGSGPLLLRGIPA